MRITYGLEKEAFLIDTKTNNPVVVDKTVFPVDECGLLVEARGKPCDTIHEAVFSVMAEEYRIKQLALKHNLKYEDSPVRKVSRNIKVEANRIYDKGKISYQNIYGFKSHRNSLNEVTAGVHISFKCQDDFYYDSIEKTQKKFTYATNFDYIKYFIALDKAFKEEINKAKRNIGFYELKSDGRIEYRSLPSNVDLMKVIDVIENVN